MPDIFDQSAIDKAVKNTLELEAAVGQGGSGQATVSFNRSWRNGWAITAYAKAWWNGDRIVSGVQTSAGIRATKTF
jgi:hypothetical protein